MKIVIMNGPPGSGKDEATNYIVTKYHTAFHFSFKRRLVDLTQALYGVSKWDWFNWYTREGKELPRAELGGKSCREALIFVSEKVVKPNFGSQYFGKQEANFISFALERDYDIAVSSDGGFQEEVYPLIDKFGKENIYVIQLHRDGCSYENDSRNYLPLYIANETYKINNVGTLQTLYHNIDTVMQEILHP
jgi:hypothetical protein